VTSFSFAKKDDSMDLKSFLSQLLSYEQLLEHQNQDVTAKASSYALLSQRPSRHPAKPEFGYQPPKHGYQPQRRPQNFSKPIYTKKPFCPLGNQAPGNIATSSNSFNTNRVACPICGKNNHQALDCFHHMDFSFQGRHPPNELAAMVSQSTALHEEDEWLADSGVNNHLTADLNNLLLQQPYQGTETMAVGNGSGIQIQNTGSSSFQTSTSNSILHLNNILHCPEVLANLLSINKFCTDNNCHFKLTDTYFLVKDNQTGKILLQGPNRDGLYPM
jgi:hypothetical protein